MSTSATTGSDIQGRRRGFSLSTFQPKLTINVIAISTLLFTQKLFKFPIPSPFPLTTSRAGKFENTLAICPISVKKQSTLTQWVCVCVCVCLPLIFYIYQRVAIASSFAALAYAPICRRESKPVAAVAMWKTRNIFVFPLSTYTYIYVWYTYTYYYQLVKRNSEILVYINTASYQAPLQPVIVVELVSFHFKDIC